MKFIQFFYYYYFFIFKIDSWRHLLSYKILDKLIEIFEKTNSKLYRISCGNLASFHNMPLSLFTLFLYSHSMSKNVTARLHLLLQSAISHNCWNSFIVSYKNPYSFSRCFTRVAQLDIKFIFYQRCNSIMPCKAKHTLRFWCLMKTKLNDAFCRWRDHNAACMSLLQFLSKGKKLW